MSSGPPIIRQVSWPATIPQFVALALAMAIGAFLGGRDAALWGGAVYLAYSIGSRSLIPRAHRAGVRLFKQQRFAEAIAKHQESFEFFERHPWIDDYRSIVLMSPSAMSYREMALLNIAFCYGQLGDGAQGRAYYQRCLERFPQSGVATAALRMLDSAASAAAQ
jgi:tetratricopeptide (TPR) repeat protein